jgi:hypothetical protein
VLFARRVSRNDDIRTLRLHVMSPRQSLASL